MTKYAMNGNGSDENIIEGKIVGGYRQDSEEGDTDILDTLGDIAQDIKQLKKKHQQKLAKAYQRTMKKRQAKAKWEDRSSSTVEVRRQGLLARQNAMDLLRAEAGKANKDRAILLAQLLKEQGDFIANGKRYLLDVMEYLIELDADIPEELQAVGQALTEIGNEELMGSYAEAVSMIGDLGFREIALATRPPEEGRRGG